MTRSHHAAVGQLIPVTLGNLRTSEPASAKKRMNRRNIINITADFANCQPLLIRSVCVAKGQTDETSWFDNHEIVLLHVLRQVLQGPLRVYHTIKRSFWNM